MVAGKRVIHDNDDMAESIGDLLDENRFAEPEEVQTIRQFLRDHFNAAAEITVQPTQIIIAVSSASLAGALRLRLYDLQELCGTNRRLVIRIF